MDKPKTDLPSPPFGEIIPKITPTPLMESMQDKQGFLAELRERSLTVMHEVSAAQADDRLDLEDLATEVVSLAQTIHGLVLMLEDEENEMVKAAAACKAMFEECNP